MSFPSAQLGDLCEMDRQGLGPDDCAAAELPFVGVENVESQSGVINFANGSRVGSQRSMTFRFDERHILYAKLRPYLNKVATPDFMGRCSTELIPLLPRGHVDREFVAYLLRRKQTVEYVMAHVTGSRMPRTDMKALLSLPVPLPPLAEQRRTVDILNRAAKIERLRKQAQELMREFIPALFVKMFGDPATNPMGWEVCKLSELSTLGPHYGANARSVPFVPTKARYIRIMDIEESGALSKEFVGVECGDFEKYRLDNGDLLFARSGGSVGKSYLYRSKDGPYIFAGYLIRFRLDKKRMHPEVLFAFTRSPAHINWVESKQRTVAQPNINGREYSNLSIPIPPISLQKCFVDIAQTAQVVVESIDFGVQTAKSLTASIMLRLLEKAA